MLRAWHLGHATRGYQNTWPHAPHFGSISFCSRRPSQYGLASGVIGFGNGRSISMEVLYVWGAPFAARITAQSIAAQEALMRSVGLLLVAVSLAALLGGEAAGPGPVQIRFISALLGATA